MRKLLIDTDCGIDDSLAILLANSAEDLEIVAITTCFGTAALEYTTRNVLRLCDYVGLKTRVAAGCDKPIVAAPREPGGFHGPTGVGLAEFPEATMKPDEAYAWDVMYEEAKKAPGELIIVTLGPVSNLGIALLKYPDLKDYVKEIVMMGGSTGAGNATAYGEANTFGDPHAWQIVMQCAIPTTMVGLNATDDCRLTTEEVNHIFSKRTILTELFEKMFMTYKRSQNLGGEMGMSFPDAATMAAVIDPSIMQAVPRYVETELTQGSMYGRTIVDIRPFCEEAPNVNVAMEIDHQRYCEMLDKCLDFYQ